MTASRLHIRPQFPPTRPEALRFALRSAVAVGLLIGGSETAAIAHGMDDKGKVEAELASGQVETAVKLGEAAVAKAPQDAGLRADLGHAYLRAGRFAAAAKALGDAATLGDGSNRTALLLALAQIACGQNRAALATLDRGDTMAPADLGLALALAGDTGRGVAVLTDAVRDGSTTSVLRQNLAYAYALDGRWADASLTAGFDLPPDQVNARLQQWAQSMQSGGERLRIARLLGVPLTDDPGMPAGLVLNRAAPGDPLANFDLARLKTEQSAHASALAAIAVPVSQAVSPEPAAAPAADLPLAAPPAAVAATPMPSEQSMAQSPIAVPSYGHFVQLGAYHSQQAAERGRLLLAKRYSHLRGHGLGITEARIRGRSYWLVVVAGVDGGKASSSLCASLKRQGGACLAYAIKPRRQGPALAMGSPQPATDRRR